MIKWIKQFFRNLINRIKMVLSPDSRIRIIGNVDSNLSNAITELERISKDPTISEEDKQQASAIIDIINAAIGNNTNLGRRIIK